MHNTDRAAPVVKVRTGPFGAARVDSTSVVAGCGFLAAPTDSTGLVLLGARFYDPDTGTFLSVDPELTPGVPAQFNAYVYAGNNPVTWADPSGRTWLHDPDRPQGQTIRMPATTNTEGEDQEARVRYRSRAEADWYGYAHRILLGPTDMTSTQIMSAIRLNFGRVFPPVAFAEPPDAKLKEVGQVFDTRLLGIPWDEVTAGRIRVVELTDTSYTIFAEEGHPEHPGEVRFAISKRAEYATLTVRARYKEVWMNLPNPMYQAGTAVLWSSFASNIRHELLRIPASPNMSPRF